MSLRPVGQEQHEVPDAPRSGTTDSPARPQISSGRETVESFVLVFLFFLVLGLEAEGFVIPTGSMAPTLMGRHKEVACPQCGLVFVVNADREIKTDRGGGKLVVSGTCVNCRFMTRVDDEPNFQGDRIYVAKTPLGIPLLPGLGRVELDRWDVAVFKLPEEPEVRYIKRLVGMPDEVVRILRGDIWVRPARADATFRRALRPLKHQDGMMMLVHDDTRRAKALKADPLWKCWLPAGGWSEPTEGTYAFNETDGRTSVLRYRHVVPDPVQWSEIIQGKRLSHPPRSTLVTDFYSYNTDLSRDEGGHPLANARAWRQAHWVGDLTLSARVDVREARGTVCFELVKAGVTGRCQVDLSTGTAKFYRGDELLLDSVPTSMKRAGTYAVVFANVDDRLSLRVDGVSPCGDGVSYDPGDGPEAVTPTAADREPAAIGAAGAALEVQSVVLSRDIYYTLNPTHFDYDAVELDDPVPTDSVAFFDWLADPDRFAAFARLGPSDYPIAPGRYMMLGDNSPWSSDGRAWQRADQKRPGNPSVGWDDSGRERWEVPESLLIGKAFCVYWPHMKPFGPTFRVGRDTRLPARPYFEKIRWIH